LESEKDLTAFINSISVSSHANFGGDVARFHVQLPQGGELAAIDLEAVE
jgi:hypothetical protein